MMKFSTMIAWGVLAVLHTPALGSTYLYVDSFDTNKAESDSWSHSPFVEILPPVHLDGVLMYTPNEEGNRGLGFYEGFEVDAFAHLSYNFPLVAVAEVRSGSLAFDVAPGPGPRMFFSVSVAYDDVPGFAVTVPGPGHYEFALQPSSPCGRVRLFFRGAGMILDNLAVCLDATTPTWPVTWGRLKARFR